MMMLSRSDSVENLVNWHWTLRADAWRLDISQHNDRVEFLAKGPLALTESNWTALFKAVKADFAMRGAEMSKVRSSFQNWTLFVNTFARITRVVEKAVDHLKALDLVEPQLPQYHSSNPPSRSATRLLVLSFVAPDALQL